VPRPAASRQDGQGTAGFLRRDFATNDWQEFCWLCPANLQFLNENKVSLVQELDSVNVRLVAWHLLTGFCVFPRMVARDWWERLENMTGSVRFCDCGEATAHLSAPQPQDRRMPSPGSAEASPLIIGVRAAFVGLWYAA
jgi:hypothetical protein